MVKESQTVLGFMCLHAIKWNSEGTAGRCQAANLSSMAVIATIQAAGGSQSSPCPGLVKKFLLAPVLPVGSSCGGVAFWLFLEGSAWGWFCPPTLPTLAGGTEWEMGTD